MKIPEWQKDCLYSVDNTHRSRIITQSEYIAIDIETTGLDYNVDRIVGISYSLGEGSASYIPISHKGGENVSISRAIAYLNGLASGRTCIFYNGKFDLRFLRRHSFKPDSWLDAQIALYHAELYRSTQISGLKKAANKLLGIEMLALHEVLGLSKVKFNKSKRNFSDLEVNEAVLAYACADADLTLRLFNYAAEKGVLGEEYELVMRLDHKLVDVITEMETTGIRIDQARLEQIGEYISSRMRLLEKSCVEEIGREINLKSPLQLRKYLYEDLNLPVLRRTPKDAPSTDNGTLILLSRKYGKKFPLLTWLMELRHLQMREKSFLSPLLKGLHPDTSRIYPNYNVARLVTGRLSATGDGVRLKRFNVQAVPKCEVNTPENIRSSFIASPGYMWLSIDMSNIELRIIANESEDRGLISEFLKEDGDVHRLTCERMFDVGPSHEKYNYYRKIAKTLNLNLAYAFSVKSVQRTLDLKAGVKMSETSCWELYKQFYNDIYPAWKDYRKKIVAKARKDQYATTLYGRKRLLHEEYKRADFWGCSGDRIAVNHPIQGTCADLLRLALVRLYCQHIPGVRLLSNVHDEINFEIKKDIDNRLLTIRKICEIMEYTPSSWRVPVKTKVSIGRSWGELMPYDTRSDNHRPPWE